jgi:hypothetical protein
MGVASANSTPKLPIALAEAHSALAPSPKLDTQYRGGRVVRLRGSHRQLEIGAGSRRPLAAVCWQGQAVRHACGFPRPQAVRLPTRLPAWFPVGLARWAGEPRQGQ